MKCPCIGCSLEYANKNNRTCRECDRRVEYVESIDGMTHSIPEESIRLKGVVKMTEIEVEETKARDRKSENRNQKPEVEVEELKETCVICHDKNKEILNKGSLTCGACYQKWNVGKIEHPTLGKFKSSLTKSKITKDKKPKSPGPITKKHSAIQENALCADGIIIKLDKYPRIKHQIDFLADKCLVNPEHVIIGLLGEALAARKERGLLDAET